MLLPVTPQISAFHLIIVGYRQQILQSSLVDSNGKLEKRNLRATESGSLPIILPFLFI